MSEISEISQNPISPSPEYDRLCSGGGGGELCKHDARHTRLKHFILYGITIISEIYFDWNLKFIWYAFYVIETNWNNDNDENVLISISGKYLLNIFYKLYYLSWLSCFNLFIGLFAEEDYVGDFNQEEHFHIFSESTWKHLKRISFQLLPRLCSHF